MTKTTYKVLIVFRNYSRAELLKNLLEEPLCCTVDVANEGLEALRLIHECSPYQLLITDLIVDEVSGFGIHMLAKEENPFIKTIALNDGTNILHNVAEQFGIEHVLDIPVDIQGLCWAARAVLDVETSALANTCS